jgi:hypothetical protein
MRVAQGTRQHELRFRGLCGARLVVFNDIFTTFAAFFSNFCRFCTVFELCVPSFTGFPPVRWISTSSPPFPNGSSPSRPRSFSRPCFTSLPTSTFTLVDLENSTRHVHAPSTINNAVDNHLTIRLMVVSFSVAYHYLVTFFFPCFIAIIFILIVSHYRLGTVCSKL